MQVDRIINGRVIYASKQRLFLARASMLLESLDGGDSWTEISVLPQSMFRRAIQFSPVLCRLLRQGFHHVEIGPEETMVIANRSTYRLAQRDFKFVETLHGSRPMGVTRFGDSFYYGEYRSNPERTPVSVWRWSPGQAVWSPVWTFEDVRHVHGVFHDRFTNTFWVTTGDEDHEAAIWRSGDGFATLDKIVGGSQQFRTVRLLFTADHVFFGSDAPDEPNYIYRMDRNGVQIDRLAKVGSSVFYGTKVGKCLFFSTAVEPSKTNYTRDSEVWCSPDGLTWAKLIGLRKDLWPMKVFQYGQILFPGGPGDDQHVFLSPFCTENHGITFKINISTVANHIRTSGAQGLA